MTATTTFNATGAVQTFVVPAGITEITAEVHGAEGGLSSQGGVPGKGGRATATLTVTPGESLSIYVGKKGATSVGGWGGMSGGDGGGGGGGSSEIRRGATTRLLAAGGGGGPGVRAYVSSPGPGGGQGGGLEGTEGASGYYGYGGAPGTQTGGIDAGAFNKAGNGSSYSGGDTSRGGGGGGGYPFGGQGGPHGGSSYYAPGGGGGGAGYGPAGTTYATGVRSGDGLVTISHAEAPNAPTLVGPIGASSIDRAAANRFSWTFDDPDPGDTQSAYDLRYRVVGAATWTTVSETTPNAYRDFPAGTFALGDYEWQARTTDQNGLVGPWSSSAFYSAVDRPDAPPITSPTNGATVPQYTTVAWSASAQDAYQVQVLDEADAVVSDSGVVEDSAARSAPLAFPENGVTRTIRVRVRDAGLWSLWYAITVQVSYTLPPVPVVALTAAGTAIVVQVTNPAPGAGEPSAVRNRVYVDDGLADGETLRARIAPNASWTYDTPRSGVDYDPLVRVVVEGDNGTEASSA